MKSRLLIGYLLPLGLSAAPYLPGTDSQVLETLPTSALAITNEYRSLRASLRNRPEQLNEAVTLARKLIELGKTESDPRYYGYAQGLLQPWWHSNDPPPSILLLRALILQNRHKFAAALLDLDRLLQQQPTNAEAWLTRALILQLQARYVEAQQSCAALINFTDTLPAATCMSQVGSLMGQGPKSYQFLTENLKQAVTATPEQRQWALTALAEMAVRLELIEDADRYFKQAIEIGQPNAYLLLAYSDFLLWQKHPQQVVDLISGKTNIDSLLLRLALAKQQLSANDLGQLINSLTARFDAGRLRQEYLHLGDEARFALYLKKQPQKALALAQTNWEFQKDPKDAVILMEAAIAAKEPKAGKSVLELLESTGMEHSQLRRLADQLKELQ